MLSIYNITANTKNNYTPLFSRFQGTLLHSTSYWLTLPTTTSNEKVCKMRDNNWKIYRGKCTTRYTLKINRYKSMPLIIIYKNNRQTGATKFILILFPLLQVSETENLRKNLAVERMIVEGCDILLDVNQVFVRQGEQSHHFTSTLPLVSDCVCPVIMVIDKVHRQSSIFDTKWLPEGRRKFQQIGKVCKVIIKRDYLVFKRRRCVEQRL